MMVLTIVIGSILGCLLSEFVMHGKNGFDWKSVIESTILTIVLMLCLWLILTH